MRIRGPALAVAALSASLAAAVATGAVAAEPTPRSVDLAVVSAIKDEGLNRSRVMETARSLSDEVGPRLTWSPGFDRAVRWAQARLQAAGASTHLEPWEPSGLAWEQQRTSLTLQAATPQVLVAQATPWSPSTGGAVEASVVLTPRFTESSQFDAFKGRLRGRIVLYGDPPADDPDADHGLAHPTPEQIAGYSQRRLTTRSNRAENLRWVRAARFDGEAARFFAAEGALAVLRSNGFGKTFVDDDGATLGFDVHLPERRQALPSAVVEADGYGRLWRLAASGAPPVVRLEVLTRFGPSPVAGTNLIGEVGGASGAFGLVMAGAHLDSWAAATGATDDGAGVAVELEALRILHAVGAPLRRRVRVALWGGEEQGELGSRAYVERHFAQVTAREGEVGDPVFLRSATAWRRSPDYGALAAYFNMDAGGGRVLGLATGGDDAAAAVFRTWLAPLADLGVTVVSPRRAEGVDRESFTEVGLPGFDVVQDLRDYDTVTHHTDLDDVARLSEPDLKQAATALAVLLYEAANADLPPRGRRPDDGRAPTRGAPSVSPPAG